MVRETIIDNNMMGAVPRPTRIDARFFYYALSQFDFSDIAQGTALPYLTVSALSALTIKCPPLADQQAIASVLGALDDKIEVNRQMNETLEELARTIFKSWFLDFEPVRAKAEGRSPAGMDAETAALFPTRFVESELGEIPEGWEVRCVEDLVERVGMGPFGSSIKVSTFVAEGIPVISGQHLRGTLLDDSTFNLVSEEHADRLKNSNVYRGDVVFTHAGSIGQVAYIPDKSRYSRYVISQRQFFARPRPKQLPAEYLVYFFRSPVGQHKLLANTSSTGVPSIARPVTYLRSIELLVPPPDILRRFAHLAQVLHAGIQMRVGESRTLAELRDLLLPKLISGELRISDAEKIVEHVA